MINFSDWLTILYFVTPILVEMVAIVAIVVTMFLYLGIVSPTFRTLVVISLWIIGVTYSSSFVIFLSSHYEDRAFRGIIELITIFVGPFLPYLMLSWATSRIDVRKKGNEDKLQYINNIIKLYSIEARSKLEDSYFYFADKKHIDAAFEKFTKKMKQTKQKDRDGNNEQH